MSTSSYSSLDAIDALSDRELQKATFLLVCALAEKVTGQPPCLLVPNKKDEPPSFIYGADAQVAWLTPPDGDSAQSLELVRVHSETPDPKPDKEAVAA
jgi:hypothetical protein